MNATTVTRVNDHGNSPARRAGEPNKGELVNISSDGWRRAARRLLLGGVIGAGVVLAVSQSASAATTATFTNGTLSIIGDGADNNIEISSQRGRRDPRQRRGDPGPRRHPDGCQHEPDPDLRCRRQRHASRSTRPTGRSLGRTCSAAPATTSLTGGSGGDQLFGQSGNDTLLGRGGFDLLFGGSENDTLTGGDADDQAFGESGDDRMIWNPGDDTDLNEGGAGNDTVEVNGGGGAEVFTATANGTRVRFDRLDPAPFAIDIGTSENLVLNANGGNDRFSATGDLAALIKLTVDGGAGDDTVLGSNGVDLLIGGDGNDFVDGQQGNDVAFQGAGDDTFQWDPGDGSDTVEGQDGTDTMLFNGSGGAELFEASANGGRLRFTRNLGNIVMDTNDVEVVDLNALGNTDTITVNDLSGTDVTRLDGDLAGTFNGTAGDVAADTVIVNGTNGDDVIDVVGAGTSATVIGLPTQVNITNSEGANDSLVVNTLGGNDGVNATTLPAGVIKLTIDGGAGGDTLLGSQGADVFRGGDGDDFNFGDNGNDVAFMGAGDDVFQWNPGDGNDTLEGQDGTDSMLFFGANVDENIDIFANGGRVLFFRNIANVTMDLDDVENIDFRALGGADNVVVGDLSGTDLTLTGLDLRGPNGGGDGAADTVTVNGTQGADTFGAAGDAGGVNVFGLHTAVNIFFQEQANDRLTLNALGGDDVVDATSLEADGMQLTMNGGLGNDSFLGSEGDDLINGGDGNDVAFMGAGDDTFVWNPGDDNDTLEGQAGFDNMLFNGANVAENIDDLRQRRARHLLPQHRQRHDGPRRRRGHRLQRPRRHRQRRRQRPQRDRRRRGEHEPRRRRRGWGRPAGQRHGPRDQRRRRRPGVRRCHRRLGPRPRHPGQHHRGRGRQRPADAQHAGRRRRGRRFRPLRRVDPAHGRRWPRRRHPHRRRGQRRAPRRPGRRRAHRRRGHRHPRRRPRRQHRHPARRR